MKITHHVKACRLVAGAALFSGLGFIAPVTAQELPQERAYLIDLNDRSVTELGSFGGGKTFPPGAQRFGAGGWGVQDIVRGLPCIYYWCEWQGDEGPWHLGRAIQPGLGHQQFWAGGGAVRYLGRPFSCFYDRR